MPSRMALSAAAAPAATRACALLAEPALPCMNGHTQLAAPTSLPKDRGVSLCREPVSMHLWACPVRRLDSDKTFHLARRAALAGCGSRLQAQELQRHVCQLLTLHKVQDGIPGGLPASTRPTSGNTAPPAAFPWRLASCSCWHQSSLAAAVKELEQNILLLLNRGKVKLPAHLARCMRTACSSSSVACTSSAGSKAPSSTAARSRGAYCCRTALHVAVQACCSCAVQELAAASSCCSGCRQSRASGFWS